MKFLDSNILAYAFYENEHQGKCREVIRDGGLVNTFNLIEAFNIIEWQMNRDIATRAIKGILKSNILIIEVDTNLLFEALKRTEKNKKLKIIDLLHYTTALLHTCSTIVSYDKDFDGLD
ncbi:MAG: type II toxin-antitoxin system VapC family toxin, partial [Nanoarchaeota archaeon]